MTARRGRRRRLIELFRHNTWANAKVFDLAASLDSQLVTEVAPGTRDTVLGTLAHLAAVEYAYLGMLEGTHRKCARKCRLGLLAN